MIAMISLVTICPIQSYYSIIDNITYTVCYIPVTYSFSNWKFVPLNSFHLFYPKPHSPLPSCSHPFVLCIHESVFISFLFLFVCFLDSTYK